MSIIILMKEAEDDNIRQQLSFWLRPLGAMSLKIQAVFLVFFFSVKNVHFNWIIGFSGTRDVFLFCREQIQQRDECDVLWQNSSKSIVFLVVAIFAKTESYSPSNLLVHSAMCRTSATYQLSACRKWYVHHSKHSMIIFVTKPISITPVLSLARKASEKILPVKTITQGKSKPLVGNIFSYQSSYWGMSTLAVPVLFKLIFCYCLYLCACVRFQKAINKLIFAYHSRDPSSPEDIPQHEVRGARPVMLLNTHQPPKLPDNLKYFDVVNNKVRKRDGRIKRGQVSTIKWSGESCS